MNLNVINYAMRVHVKNNNKIVFVKSKIIWLNNKTIIELNNKDKKT